MTDEELDALEQRTKAIEAQAPRCACPCGCQYVLMSTPSQASGVCWSCRHTNHYGGSRLLEEETS